MQAFVTVADLQGFAPAARKLGLSPSGVTRLIAALEDRLGARLLQRTTRSVTLTDAGTRYLERARRILSRCRGSRGRGRGRAHAAGRTAGGVGAGRLRPAARQSGDVGLSDALSRGRRSNSGCRIAWSIWWRTASIWRCGSVTCRIRRWWRAMSARCGGSWWPPRIISSAHGEPKTPAGDRRARHHPVRRHDRGAGLALRRGRPRDPRLRARRALRPTAPTPPSNMPSRAAG